MSLLYRLSLPTLINLLWSILKRKGIFLSYISSVFFIVAITLAEIETMTFSGSLIFKEDVESNQYLPCFVFLAFTRLSLNKINFEYLVVNQFKTKHGRY
jgi:hypothetical protein